MAKRLAGAQGAMEPGSRMAVINALVRNASTDLRYMRAPSREALIRIAAHCIAWAEELDEGTGL
jgi:hypothetical protein